MKRQEGVGDTMNFDNVTYNGKALMPTTKTYKVQTPTVTPTTPTTNTSMSTSGGLKQYTASNQAVNMPTVQTPSTSEYVRQYAPQTERTITPIQRSNTDIANPNTWMMQPERQFESVYRKMEIPDYDTSTKFGRLKAIWRQADLDYEKSRHLSYQMDGKENIYDDIKKASELFAEKYPDLDKAPEYEEAKRQTAVNTPFFGNVMGLETQTNTANQQIQQGIEDATRMVPLLGKSTGAAVSAGVPAFVAGSLVNPTVGAWGAKIAGSAAAGKVMYDIERGSAYEEFIGEGIPEETAKKWATLVGAINAGIEVAEVVTLAKTIPGADKFLAKAGTKKVTASAVKTYLKTIASETGQEVLQEAVTVAGGESAKKEAGMEYKYFTAENKDRLIDTAVTSARSFAFMALPGTVAGGVKNMSTAKAKANAEKARADVSSKLDTITANPEVSVDDKIESIMEIKAISEIVEDTEIVAKADAILEQYKDTDNFEEDYAKVQDYIEETIADQKQADVETYLDNLDVEGADKYALGEREVPISEGKAEEGTISPIGEKVAEKEVKPKIVYHGTGGKFDTFDLEKSKSVGLVSKTVEI